MSHYKDALNQGYCGGYVSGMVDALAGTSFCPSEGVTLQQAADIVKMYLRDNPEKRHLPASDLVTTALKEKFPCN